jgi:capsular exopolysaccharide synthesis family protein
MPATQSNRAVKPPAEENKIDFRIYVGIILFRWQIIAVCFLYSMLAGVLYITFAPKKYQSSCNLMIYKDSLIVGKSNVRYWEYLQPHVYMLKNPKTLQKVIDKLAPEYAEKLGGRNNMMPKLSVGTAKGLNPMVHITVQSGNPEYGREFLKALIDEHREQWNGIQRQSKNAAGEVLEEELARLVEKIKKAEDNKIDFQRLHDIARVEARGSAETRYLMALMGRRNQLTTELMLLEAQYPALEDANASVISNVGQLTKETGSVEAVPEETKDGIPLAQNGPLRTEPVEDESIKGFQDLRVKLINLEEEKKNLEKVLKDDHPKLRAIRVQMKSLQEQLDAMAEVQLRKLRDRHKSLTIQLDAIEASEYKWKNKNYLASQYQAEYKRLVAVVKRFEDNYSSIYSRLHTMRVSEELKAERIIPEDIRGGDDPVWPDATKILMMALAAGLGSGFGLAFLLQVVDNKVQSIKDVEDILGVPFLGGIPYWAHSGLENAIRPIVTEEHSTGAVEAYRALRTTILAEMNKRNEKILFTTSADSREGKTLTSLNMSIMIAQMGKRILVVDMDLRRGRLHRSLGLNREPGVTDILREGGSLKDVIQHSRIKNLDFAPAGSTIDDASELLQSADIVQMFVDVQDDYDYIIVDTSPVLRVTDTVIVTTQGIGVVLYVARVNHTPKPMIRYSLDMLKDAEVLGLVMNSIEMHKISSLYYAYQYPNYAYYSNAYTYGYDYYYYDETGGSRRRHKRNKAKHGMRRAGRWLRNKIMPTE